MKRLLAWVLAVSVGVVLGMLASLFLWDPEVVVEFAGQPASTILIAAPTTTANVTTSTAAPMAPGLLVVWTSGGLPDDLAGAVGAIEGVDAVSVVRSDLILVGEVFDASGAVVDQPPSGWFIPVEAAAIDSAFDDLAPIEWQAYLSGLSATDAILGETSATVRRVTVGATLASSGVDLRIIAVLPDVVIGGSELVVTQEVGEQLGVTTPRYLLVVYQGDRAGFEDAVRSALPVDTPVRVRALGETPFLRHGDAVLPQVLIKAAFGEFNIRPNRSGSFEPDPEWVERHVFTTDLPLIGEAACHAAITTSLTAALEEIERSNLGFLVETFDGCFFPRFIAGTRALSRHAWGAAIDLNYAANPTGQVTVQDPRLVSIMERWGFTWGGNWLVPDAAHFEWVGPPTP